MKKQSVPFRPLAAKYGRPRSGEYLPQNIINSSILPVYTEKNTGQQSNNVDKQILKQVRSNTPKQSDVDRIFSQSLQAAGGKKLDRKVIKYPLYWPDQKGNSKATQAKQEVFQIQKEPQAIVKAKSAGQDDTRAQKTGTEEIQSCPLVETSLNFKKRLDE